MLEATKYTPIYNAIGYLLWDFARFSHRLAILI